MPFRTILHVIFGNLVERKARTAGAILVIAFAAAVVTVVSALNLGFLREIRRKALEAFPPGVLLVKPRTLSISALSFNTTLLNEKVVGNIRKLPGVQYAARQLSIKVPMRAEGEVMGQHAETDAFVVGIDKEVVETEIGNKAKFEYDEKTTSPVPCVLPRLFVDMYNLAYAPSMGLPAINAEFPIGKHFDLHMGETFLLGDAGNRKMTVTCKIVGLSDNPTMMSGLLIPIEYAEQFNKWFTGKDVRTYSALHVKVSDVKYLDNITSTIQGMGLISQSNTDELRKIHLIVSSVGVLGSVFAAVVLAIAVIAVINMFSLIMAQRRGEVGLMRAVGGTRPLVTGLFLLELAAMSLAGAVLGTGFAGLLLKLSEAKVRAMLPKLSLVPDHIFLVPIWLPFAVAGLAALICIIATFPVIHRTTKLAPVKLIAED